MATGDKLMTASEIKAVTDTKVDVVAGKGLSTEDYTTAEKAKLQGIAAGAQVNSVTGVKGNAESSYRTGNVNVTRASIGLFTSVGQLGLTSGSVTILDAYNAIANGCMLFATASEFASGECPSEYGSVHIDKSNGAARSQVFFYGKRTIDDDYRMYCGASAYNNNNNDAPNGTWIKIITQIKGDAEGAYRTGNVNLTATNIGLGNVDNTSDADKPISTATQAALDSKVNIVTGKGLSTNDFTNEYKAQLDALNATIQSLTSRIQTLEAKNYILYDA